jgi:predicted peptidase
MTYRSLLSAAVLLTAAVLAHASSPETGFLNRTLTVDGVMYRYVVYVPMGWSADQKWPVVLFLHGAGERGDEGLAQSDIGLGKAIRTHPDRFPAVVVMPQCRKNDWWQSPAMEAQALAALDAASKEFNGDADRTYLTGLSMGGYGSWDVASKVPNRFAAVAVVCGGILLPPAAKNLHATPQPDAADPYSDTAKKVARLPIWVFHGGADPTVPVTESRKMVEALKALNADVRYTEYEGVGHNSWDKAYGEVEFATWLFSHKRVGDPGPRSSGSR